MQFSIHQADKQNKQEREDINTLKHKQHASPTGDQVTVLSGPVTSFWLMNEKMQYSSQSIIFFPSSTKNGNSEIYTLSAPVLPGWLH